MLHFIHFICTFVAALENSHAIYKESRSFVPTSATAWSADSIFSNVINAQLETEIEARKTSLTSNHTLDRHTVLQTVRADDTDDQYTRTAFA